MHPTGGHWTLKSAFLFIWDVTNTVASVTTTKLVSGMFSNALQYVDVWKYFEVVMLVMSGRLSQAWVIYLPVACIQWESKMMPWEISSSTDGTLTYTDRVLISWDPGGLNSALAPAWVITRLQFSQLTWDPGGCMKHRLEGKQIGRAHV